MAYYNAISAGRRKLQVAAAEIAGNIGELRVRRRNTNRGKFPSKMPDIFIPQRMPGDRKTNKYIYTYIFHRDPKGN